MRPLWKLYGAIADAVLLYHTGMSATLIRRLLYHTGRPIIPMWPVSETRSTLVYIKYINVKVMRVLITLSGHIIKPA
jgi:hypothetical protein